ncbi:hypothetical protein CKO11_10725 [Rhodobacter sp. TJ_12]|uniref:Hint domain-containing protein n=1 Tax=Rhodobacter sp. TJ_12 TaxID=2029399 RepID=UPI001CBE6076|nr:Hint domain-containing protein [Rhodobacter sp. TJ_12]MBZ4022933.1 hypothetical protein [Rhodobacter sp. TJ_12]
MANIYGTSGNDSLLGTRYDDRITGAAGDDTLAGEGGHDRIEGGTGNDVLSGGTGNDTLIGNEDNDVIDGGAGDDQIYGGTGDDTLSAGAGANTVYGGAGNDVWLGGDSLAFGTDAVYLEEGDDLAYVGWFVSGAPDTIDAGTGNDTLSLENIPGAYDLGITLNDTGAATTSGFGSVVSGFENVIGNDGNNALTGNSAANMLDGGLGNDTLSGNAGDDSLYGGAGDDSVIGGTGADLLTGDAGSDTLAGGDGNDTLSGGAENDLLYGDADADSLDGGTGDDTLDGGAGDDTLHGGAGADQLNGGTGMDYADYADSDAGVNVNLASGTGTGGDAEGDRLGGIDGIYGSAYADTLIGFDLADYSDSETAFTNVFYGNGGDDYIDGAGADDSLYGCADDDTVLGGAGNDLVDGGTGNDSLDGGDGNDTVLGGAGDDTLWGGAGDDYLDAGSGAATIDGGTGSDTIYVHANEDSTIIGSEDPGDTDTDVLILERNTGATITYREDDPESGTILWANGTTTNFSNIENVQYVPCFTPGTRVETKRGLVAVERLKRGDKVLTRDNGYQRIRWIGRRSLGAAELAAGPQLQPVRIARGALGAGLPETDMVVSPQHRMLISGPRAELLFGEGEVLAAALHMVGQPGITREAVNAVTYLHLMFDAHEIIRADGAWTESFQPGDHTLSALEAAQRDELFALFPDLRQARRGGRWAAARLSLKPHEVRVLLAA